MAAEPDDDPAIARAARACGEAARRGPPDVTVVLPTFDRRHVLEHTIDAWRAEAGDALLVIDDGSRDGTAGWLRGLGVRVHRVPHRRGLPAARNAGLALATTRWVFFAEDDVLPSRGLLDRLVAGARTLPRARAVAGQLLATTAWERPDRPVASAGPLFDARTLRGDFASAIERPRPAPTAHACALVDRRAALAIGGYDTAYVDSAFREESDFYARLWRAGGATWLVPDAWAAHVAHRLGGGCRGGSGVARKLRNRASYWRNDARYIDRHHRFLARWFALEPPGRLKARSALRIVALALRAWRS